MWTCSLLKGNARQALSGRYWRSFWVCLVVALVSGGYATTNLRFDYSLDDLYGIFDSLTPYVATIFLVAALVGALLGFFWMAFIVSPLSVGSCRYFMESRQAPAPFRTLFSVFQTPYLNVVKVQFLTNLKISLGMLLLLIPGIYWSYCYTLVPYLLAENPYLSTTRAMELSQELMYGEKFHFFVLQLSFIGWDLLCMVTFGIGFYFLAPYKNTTYAEFYAAMRAKALNQGFSGSDELGGFVRHDCSSL